MLWGDPWSVNGLGDHGKPPTYDAAKRKHGPSLFAWQQLCQREHPSRICFLGRDDGNFRSRMDRFDDSH